MPATHLSLHYHLVFSTKERYPWILQQWRSDLHAYLGGRLCLTRCQNRLVQAGCIRQWVSESSNGNPDIWG